MYLSGKGALHSLVREVEEVGGLCSFDFRLNETPYRGFPILNPSRQRSWRPRLHHNYRRPSPNSGKPGKSKSACPRGVCKDVWAGQLNSPNCIYCSNSAGVSGAGNSVASADELMALPAVFRPCCSRLAWTPDRPSALRTVASLAPCQLRT
jgi:hypothetical protein